MLIKELKSCLERKKRVVPVLGCSSNCWMKPCVKKTKTEQIKINDGKPSDVPADVDYALTSFVQSDSVAVWLQKLHLKRRDADGAFQSHQIQEANNCQLIGLWNDCESTTTWHPTHIHRAVWPLFSLRHQLFRPPSQQLLFSSVSFCSKCWEETSKCLLASGKWYRYPQFSPLWGLWLVCYASLQPLRGRQRATT